MADDTLLSLAAEIVAAHVANNKVAIDEVAGLVSATYAALAGVGQPTQAEQPQEEEFVPATTVKRSLANPDRIVSMIDGKPYSSLTRHLRKHGLTPDQYRERYKLKPDYPMVAPGYSDKRRAKSLELGLGRKKVAVPEPAPARDDATDAPERKPRRRMKLNLSGSDALKKVRGGKQQSADASSAGQMASGEQATVTSEQSVV